MDNRITMNRVAACLDELGLNYDRRDEDDTTDLRVPFTGEFSRYSIWFKLDHFGPRRANLNVRAYVPLSGDPRQRIPAMAIKPGRLAQLHVLLNLINAQLRCGALHVDPGDGDLTFAWAIPLEVEPSTDLIDFAMHMAYTIDGMIPNVRAVVIEGKTAWEVYAAHRERVSAPHTEQDGSADADPPVLDLDGIEIDDPDGWDDTEDDGPMPFRRAV
jgi:hypothetical protein